MLAVDWTLDANVPSSLSQSASPLGKDIVASLAARTLGNDLPVALAVAEFLEHHSDQSPASLALADVHGRPTASDATGPAGDLLEAAAPEPTIATAWTDLDVPDFDCRLDVAPSVTDPDHLIFETPAQSVTSDDSPSALTTNPSVDDLVVNPPSLDAATTFEEGRSATFHPARNDSPGDLAIATASPDNKALGCPRADDGTTDAALAGLASTTSAETDPAAANSNAFAGNTTFEGKAENLVSATATADDASANTFVHLLRAASLAPLLDDTADTSLLAVAEEVSDVYDGLDASANVAVSPDGWPSVGFTAAGNAADAAESSASASVHFAEEVDGGLHTPSPVAAIAADLRLGANHQAPLTLDAFVALDANANPVNDGGLVEAVTDASTTATRSETTAEASDNPTFLVASTANQTFGDNNDGESSSSADSPHTLLGPAAGGDVSAANLAHAALAALHSPIIFTNLAVPAAHSSADRSAVAATATSSPPHAAKTSEFNQNVIDVCVDTLASARVASTNDFPGSSAWTTSNETADSLDAFAVAALEDHVGDNVFAASAAGVLDAPRGGAANENSVVADDFDASVRDEPVSDNSLVLDTTGETTAVDSTTSAAADTLAAFNASQAAASTNAVSNPGDQLTTTTASANSALVPLTPDAVGPHSPSAATQAAVEFVAVGVNITNAISTAENSASWAAASAMTSLPAFLSDTPASPANSSSVDGVANSESTDGEASAEFLLGNPDGRSTAHLALAPLHDGVTTFGAFAKTSNSVSSYDKTTSGVTSL